ncbi:ubiquinone biosynthesis protein [Acuticoccus sediminis]|uniref:Ubiquinone biosynthesis protein n=1 Tax=Acuticoccus sediminis TaxID=2184697 RepID=A0A8B2NYZ2_9HYPH|nr:class I SAM-dependent methyltransferase [Acuticoccus sediminis]RAI03375.1 ubiquinone biosynthesis protein [Acuticoccus sediminis]
MSVDRVTSHYAPEGFEQRIDDAIRAAGLNPQHFSALDIAPMDEFHLGGLDATHRVAQWLAIGPGDRVLDVGAGLGGPARAVASQMECQVTGMDLTPQYVALGNKLSARCGLAARVTLIEGDVTKDLPDQAFDAAMMLHVGMNIADKTAVFRAVRRALVPGARFVVYDVMSSTGRPLEYPVPWSATEDTSFVESPEQYIEKLEVTDFTIETQGSLLELAMGVLAAARARAEAHGPPPLGLHVLFEDKYKARFANLIAALNAGDIAPIMIVARAA